MKSLPDLIIEARQISKEIQNYSEDVYPYDLEILKDINEVQKKEKIDGYSALMEQFKREAEMWEEQEKLCKSQKQKLQNLLDRFKDRLKECMKLAGTNELEGYLARFVNVNMKPKLVVDETKLPKKYLMPVTTYQVDKDALRFDLEQGEIIEGAHLEPVTALRKYP
jgi:hypothetical protein